MSDLLKDHYRVKVANNGEKALKIVRGDAPPDLILLDIMMPGLSGYEVCEQLKADPETRDIPVIFLTAMTAVEDEKKGLELGAVDYITKPISPPIVLARVKTHLKIKAAADFLRDKNAFLEAEVARAHARGRRDPGRDHPRHGLARRDARQRHRQPHPPHPVLRQGARRAAEGPPALPPLPDRADDQPAVQVGAAARHRQGRHPRPHPAQARRASRPRSSRS